MDKVTEEVIKGSKAGTDPLKTRKSLFISLLWGEVALKDLNKTLNRVIEV